MKGDRENRKHFPELSEKKWQCTQDFHLLINFFFTFLVNWMGFCGPQSCGHGDATAG